MRVPGVASIAGLAGLLFGSTPAFAQSEGLGMVSFPNSGQAAAQPPFLRGVLLLHNFEYEDAATAFRAAQAVDPDFALAYWGEALTWQRLLWGQDFLAEARAALAKLGADPESRASRAGTPREKAYVAAVEALLSETDLDARTAAYETAMADLYARFPEDDEAAAFYALSILMSGDDGVPLASVRAAALLEDVARRNPYHPGAIHYLIHSYDSPDLAPLGLHWARVYSRLAPEAEHALHMPSHIFINMGLWKEVAASNEASTRASYAWLERNGLDVLDLDYHSHQWLSYAYLQLGRRAAAREIVDSVTRLLEGKDVHGRHWNIASGVDIQNVQWGFETGDWSFYAGRDLPRVDPSLTILEYALPLYGRGMAAARSGNSAMVEQVSRLLRAEGAPDPTTRTVLALEIEAWHALTAGDRERAVDLSTQAIQREAGFRRSSPAVFQPPFEVHGEILLDAGRYREAAAAFDRALANYPGRARSLLGRARASAQYGDTESAERLYRRLLENWATADPDLPELLEAMRATQSHD